MKPSVENTKNGSQDPLHDLRKRMEENDAYVLKLVDMIPAKWYFDQETVGALTEEIHQKIDEKVKSSKKLHGLSTHGKHKLARLDSSTVKTVSQILKEQGHSDKTEKRKKKKKKSSKPGATTLHSAALDRASNLDELKQRLSEKIEAMKSNRKTAVTVSREERKAAKLAEKKAARKRKKNKAAKGGELSSASETKDAQEKSPQKKPKIVPIFNKEGKMVFSKFDLAESETPAAEKKHAGKSPNQPKKLLKKLDAEAQKLKELEEKNPERAKEVKQKRQWLKAIDKAEGIKVKDNPELLKKSMKRKLNRKKQSQKKWKARTESLEQKQKERQEKRQKNIELRKKAKLQKKMKKLKKKGHIVPGF